MKWRFYSEKGRFFVENVQEKKVESIEVILMII